MRVRQARPALPRRDSQRVLVISRRVWREVLLEVRYHFVDRYAVRVEEGVVVAPINSRVSSPHGERIFAGA